MHIYNKKENLMKLILTLFFLSNIFLIGCKEKEELKEVPANTEYKPKGIVLFTVGDVKADGKELLVGNALEQNTVLKTGKKSACDLQITGLETDITIRLKENSEFTLQAFLNKEEKNLKMNIKSGKAIINTQKLNKNDRIETITPTAVVGVRGTKYEVEVKKDSSSAISVFEGTVTAKLIIPEIAELSNEIVEKSATIKKLNDYLNEKELVIESGNTSTITRKYAEKILKDTGIGKILKSADKSKLAEELDAKIIPENLKETISKLKDKDIQAPIVKLATKTFEEKLKEYEEIIAIEKQKLSDPKLMEEEIKKRFKSPELMNRIEEIMDTSAQTLLLKSGERINGIIFKEGNKFIVLTPEGRKEYEANLVQDIEL